MQKRLSFPKFVSFCHFSVPEELFFAILHTKVLIGNRKGDFYLYQKQGK